MVDHIECSIIIPSYNSTNTIWACLDAVTAQDWPEPYEVIVVDSSNDATPQLIRDNFHNVKLISLERKTDPGTARNIGVAQAKGEILAFIDSDCVASPDWLRRLMAHHATGHDVVGGAVENGNPDSLVGWAGYISEFREFLPAGNVRLTQHIPTCNISYKQFIFEKYGGFKGEYYPQEDLLYNWHLQRQGVPIVFDPKIRVAHIHRTKTSNYLRHQVRIGRVTAHVLKKTDLPGSWILRWPSLVTLALPVLLVVKFWRTLVVFLRWNWKAVLRRCCAWTLFFFGLLAWSVGFAQGAWKKAPPVSVLGAGVIKGGMPVHSSPQRS
jgi:glycosyltransferase involved in cell wall biosynthesis